MKSKFSRSINNPEKYICTKMVHLRPAGEDIYTNLCHSELQPGRSYISLIEKAFRLKAKCICCTNWTNVAIPGGVDSSRANRETVQQRDPHHERPPAASGVTLCRYATLSSLRCANSVVKSVDIKRVEEMTSTREPWEYCWLRSIRGNRFRSRALR